jgi:DUF4097 and DUF4098 domain-containing protein YvlB
MMRRRCLFVAMLLVVAPATVRDAAAQDTRADVTVQVRRDIVRAVTRAIDEPLREMARDLQDAMRDLASDIDVDVERARRQGLSRTTSRGDIVDRQTQPLKLGPSGAIDITTTGGNITVTAGSGPPTLEVIRRARTRIDADTQRALAHASFVIDERAGHLRVRANDTTDGRSGASIEVSFVATVPAATELHLTSTGGGAIAVTGVRGETSAHTTGGAITLTGTGQVALAWTFGGPITITDAQGDGDMKVHAVGGDVSLSRVKTRQLSVDTVGGTIRVTDVTAREVSMNTLSGRLTYRGALAPDGHYDLHTHSGTIHFEPTGSVGFDLDARSYSGDITIDPAVQLHTRTLNRRGVTGTSGSGDAVVVIGTFSGNVTIGAVPKQ